MTNSNNIFLLSTNEILSNSVAEYLKKEFALKEVSLEALENMKDGQHTVTIISTVCDLDLLGSLGYVANLNDYNTSDISIVSGHIFDDACDHFLGEYSTEELLACA